MHEDVIADAEAITSLLFYRFFFSGPLPSPSHFRPYLGSDAPQSAPVRSFGTPLVRCLALTGGAAGPPPPRPPADEPGGRAAERPADERRG